MEKETIELNYTIPFIEKDGKKYCQFGNALIPYEEFVECMSKSLGKPVYNKIEHPENDKIVGSISDFNETPFGADVNILCEDSKMTYADYETIKKYLVPTVGISFKGKVSEDGKTVESIDRIDNFSIDFKLNS